jgi:hypothetical protein
MNGASGLGAGMAQRAARLELKLVVSPVRVGHAQARHPKLDASRIKGSDGLKLLRGRGALQCREVDRMNGFVHGEIIC